MVAATTPKKKFRYGVIIATFELGNKEKLRELQTENAMIDEYIGISPIWNGTAYIWVYQNKEAAERALREAKKIGFHSAGLTDEPIYVSNRSLMRPHLRKSKNHAAFMRELYK